MKYLVSILTFLNKHLDKIAHIFFGLCISFISYLVFRSYEATISIIIIVAYLKQYLDIELSNNQFDVYDFYATNFGGILGLLMWLVK